MSSITKDIMRIFTALLIIVAEIAFIFGDILNAIYLIGMVNMMLLIMVFENEGRCRNEDSTV